MKTFPIGLLAGVASVAFAGVVAAHTLSVQLPDGTTEQIHYAGDVAPQISFVPLATRASDAATDPNAPFALMQQIAVQMDREAVAMMRQMQALAVQPVAGPGQPIQVDLSRLPPGTQSYRFVSTLSLAGACSESTEIIAKGPGQKPQVITHRSGNCGAPGGSGALTKAASPGAAAVPAQLRERRYEARFAHRTSIDHPDYRSMFREASW